MSRARLQPYARVQLAQSGNNDLVKPGSLNGARVIGELTDGGARYLVLERTLPEPKARAAKKTTKAQPKGKGLDPKADFSQPVLVDSVGE